MKKKSLFLINEENFTWIYRKVFYSLLSHVMFVNFVTFVNMFKGNN